VEVNEIVIETRSACAGRQVSEISWPRNCVIASLRRGEEMLIARGETILHEGDILMMIADESALREVQRLCRTI